MMQKEEMLSLRELRAKQIKQGLDKIDSDEVEDHVAAFLAAGGSVQLIPIGHQVADMRKSKANSFSLPGSNKKK